MENYIFSENFNKVHFIGAGGISMSGLIKHLVSLGKTVSGSDLCKNSITEQLESIGVKMYYKHSAENVKDADAVVYTSAIADDNAELIQAKNLGVPLIKRSQLLGAIIGRFNKSVAVSGSHGKTTATAMIANVLNTAKKSPTVFLGGEYKDYGNYLKGDQNFVVAEACEFKKNFLDIKADVSVVLNIDTDHLDCYKGIKDMTASFRAFVGNSLAVINADDKNSRGIFNSTTVTFGIEKLATYMAKKIKFTEKGYSFTAYAHGLPLGRINLNIAGRHNIYNALACLAACDLLGVPFKYVKEGVESFCGVKRRNEYLGDFNGLKTYADYAHHPKELSATLKTFSENESSFITVFQPHTYSRTEILIDDFVSVLKDCTPLIIYKTYAARERYKKIGSAKYLFEKIKECSGDNVYYADTPESLKIIIENLKSDYKTAVFLGAGDIYDIVKSFLDKN